MVTTIKRGIYISKGETINSTSNNNREQLKAPLPTHKSPPLNGLKLEIYNVIKQYKNGVSVSRIRERSGLEVKQVSNVLYKLTKDGLIKKSERGVYCTNI